MIAVASFRKKTSASSKKWSLDRMFRQLIRERDETCRFGYGPKDCWGELQVAHFYPRRHLTVRWDPNNAALLCAAHHGYLDGHPDQLWVWVTNRLGADVLADLRARRDLPWSGKEGYDQVLRDLTILLNGGT